MNYLATFYCGHKPMDLQTAVCKVWQSLTLIMERLEALHPPFDANLGGPDVRGAPNPTAQNYVQLTVSFIMSTNLDATAVQGYQQSVPQTPGQFNCRVLHFLLFFRHTELSTSDFG